MVRVVGGEKVGKKLVVLIDRIDRQPQKTGLATQTPRTAARSDGRKPRIEYPGWSFITLEISRASVPIKRSPGDIYPSR